MKFDDGPSDRPRDGAGGDDDVTELVWVDLAACLAVDGVLDGGHVMDADDGVVAQQGESRFLISAGIGAEERHIAEAIAVNLRELMILRTPIVAVIIGEIGRAHV